MAGTLPERGRPRPRFLHRDPPAPPIPCHPEGALATEGSPAEGTAPGFHSTQDISLPAILSAQRPPNPKHAATRQLQNPDRPALPHSFHSPLRLASQQSSLWACVELYRCQEQVAVFAFIFA